jgi:hypothetical protein
LQLAFCWAHRTIPPLPWQTFALPFSQKVMLKDPPRLAEYLCTKILRLLMANNAVNIFQTFGLARHQNHNFSYKKHLNTALLIC